MDIAFTRARTTRIRIDGTPHIPDNLVEKAAILVIEALHIQADIQFKLKKRIPTGAGLGGGSSDAASVLLALPVLAGKPLPPDRLFAIAAQLGSDVPFFLHGGTALGLGRGEELYPLPSLPPRRGVVVAPDVHSSTAEAYRDLSPRLTSNPLQNTLFSFQQEIWQAVSGGGVAAVANDFEEVVFARQPELRGIKERLRRFGANPAAMTGSGSAIFGIFDDVRQLARARKAFTDKTVFPISFLSCAQYRSAWLRALHPHVEGTLWPPQSLYARSQSAR